MSKLTGTHSEAASYEFTTLTTVPGTIQVHGCPIQILDLRASLSEANDHPPSASPPLTLLTPLFVRISRYY